VHLAAHYVLAPGLQEGRFVHEDLIFATGPLVPVVYSQDFHRAQVNILAFYGGAGRITPRYLDRFANGMA
jgi:hypothetical protein